MKKLFILSAVAVLLTVTVNAQTNIADVKKDEAQLKKEQYIIKKKKKEDRKELRKLEGKQVSNQSKMAFYEDFGNITVIKWERTANFDEATFKKDGFVMKAYYDANMKLVGTTTHKLFSDIPTSAKKEINKRYQEYSKVDVIFFHDNEQNETDMIIFDNQFDDADNYFLDLKKDDKEIVLQININGDVSFFKQIK